MVKDGDVIHFYSAFRLKNAYLIVIYIKKLYKEVL